MSWFTSRWTYGKLFFHGYSMGGLGGVEGEVGLWRLLIQVCIYLYFLVKAVRFIGHSGKCLSSEVYTIENQLFKSKEFTLDLYHLESCDTQHLNVLTVEKELSGCRWKGEMRSAFRFGAMWEEFFSNKYFIMKNEILSGMTNIPQ